MRSIACPQRRSATIFPCRCAPFLARQNSRRPPLSAVLRPFGCGSIAPGLSIAIKAARGGFPRPSGGSHHGHHRHLHLRPRRLYSRARSRPSTSAPRSRCIPSKATRKALPPTASTPARSSSGQPGPRRPRRAVAMHQVRRRPLLCGADLREPVENEESGSFALIWNRPKPNTRSAAARATTGARAATERPNQRLAPTGRGAHRSRPAAYRDACGPTPLARSAAAAGASNRSVPPRRASERRLARDCAPAALAARFPVELTRNHGRLSNRAFQPKLAKRQRP